MTSTDAMNLPLRDKISGIENPLGALQAMFAHSPVPYILFTAEGNAHATNPAYRQMFGSEPPAAYNVLMDEEAKRVGLSQAVRRAFAGEFNETPPAWFDPKPMRQVPAPPSKQVAISCSLLPLFGDASRVKYVAVAFKDVTAEFEARDHAEVTGDELKVTADEKAEFARALRESQERLRQTLEAAEVGTWEWNIPEDKVEWSSNIESIFGLTHGSFGGTYQDWFALVHPDDRSFIQQRLNDTLTTKAPYEAEFRFLRGDGSTGWQSTRGYLVSDEDNQPHLLRGIVFDVTARRVAEDALKMPGLVLDSMSEGVCLTSSDGIILYTNPAEDRMFGYGRGELQGRHVSVQNDYPPEENQRLVAAVISHLKAKGEWTGEWRNRRKDGTAFTTRSRITAFGRDGVLHFVCVQEDISAEVKARQDAEQFATALRESESRYRTFLEQSSEGIWRIELERPVDISLSEDEQLDLFYEFANLAECNDAMARMYGFSLASDLQGARLGDLLVRQDPRNVEYLKSFIRSGYRLENGESHELDKDGQLHVFHNSLVGFIESGHLCRAWGTQRDVTAQVEARRQAESASRAKDEFLAMLGHELRNPLSPILTALELMKLRDASAFQRERAIIERQVKHVVRLVDDLLDVSRMTRGKVTLEKARLDLADCLASAIELASPLLEQRAHGLSVEVPRGLIVEGDATRLGQVFANLLTNAAKYTPAGGKITITARSSNDTVKIIVRDTGVGIRPEMLPCVFDLFVQERQNLDRSEGGLGLGLAIVRTLVTMHGGHVEAQSEGPGRGSDFTVTLPLAGEEPLPLAPAPGADTQPSAGSWRVLVVDDNQDAADLLADALRLWGHVVRVAHDGPSALAILQDYEPDVGLLDIGLPVMDGYELARRIRAQTRLSHVRLLALTGYGQAKDREASFDAGFAAHIVKPVDLMTLETTLVRVMTTAG